MAKRKSNLARTNLLLIPAVAAAVGAGLVTTSPAQAAPSPRGDIVAKKNGEDEDAFVQLRPTSGYTDKGTGFFNQVRRTRGSKVRTNYVKTWLSVYGLAPDTAHTMYIGAGRCPGSKKPIGSTILFTTDFQGGWTGKVKIDLGKRKTWVVRGKHHLSITADANVASAVVSCGRIVDDPDLAD
ncbi:MAG: hypothetical protein V9E85_00805 [Candidatus Nanopelagicales bacterium]